MKKLSHMTNIIQEMESVYSEMRSGKLPTSEGTRLVYALKELVFLHKSKLELEVPHKTYSVNDFLAELHRHNLMQVILDQVKNQETLKGNSPFEES